MRGARAPRLTRARRVLAGAVLLLAAAAPTGCARTARPPGAVTPSGTPDVATSLRRFGEARVGTELDVLVLSGGGQNGAFGAGVLRGWRRAGRPGFAVVTGISTGALQATHAFLGTPADDDALERAYVDATREGTLCMRSPLAAAAAPSVADFGPLRARLATWFDDATLARVAAASEGGRRLLLVGTTNLDTGRMRVWDLGELARRGAYDLYREVLLASASPPVLASPVMLDGAPHADGGVLGNVLVPNLETNLAPEVLARWRATLAARFGPGRSGVTLHVVYNGVLAAAPERVDLALLPLASRSLSLLMGAAGHGSLWYLHGLAARRGHGFRWVGIPDAVRSHAEDPFGFRPASLRALYDAGVAAGADPASWTADPPPLPEDGAGR